MQFTLRLSLGTEGTVAAGNPYIVWRSFRGWYPDDKLDDHEPKATADI